MQKEAAQHASSGSASRFGFCTSGWSGLGIKANPIVTFCKRKRLVPGIYLYCCARFPFSLDKSYLKHTSIKKIIASFIRLRVKIAKTRHDLAFFHNINPAQRSPHSILDHELEKIFPPRRKWIQLGKEKRISLSPIERNSKVLSLMVSAEEKKPESEQEDWYRNLVKKAEALSLKMQAAQQGKLNPPKIRPVPKNNSSKKYRPIAKFNLSDHMRIGATANYIRQKIDPVLLPCSYAFRSKNPVTGTCPTHHDSVSALIAYRKKNIGKTLYVAECDIQKFFDIVNHNVAKDSLYKLMKALKKTKDKKFDSRAIQTFLDYLDCYTYEGYAVPEANKFFVQKGKHDAALDRPNIDSLKEFYTDPTKEKYGIPQGGAISPVLANIILHWADMDIYSAYEGQAREDLFYARYCDDMILIHTDKDTCSHLLNVYCQSLNRLNLLVHEPQEFKKYDKSFYEVKSKKPYPWAAPQRDRSTVPWVSFVGYQIGHDGNIRIRKTSIEKEIEKQKKIAVTTLQSIRKKGNLTEKSAHQIIYRLKSKLASMAVGKRYKNTIEPASGMCWATGFKLLARNPYPQSQLRQLDYAREKGISMVKRALVKRAHDLSQNNAIRHIGNRKNFNKYFGGPFSYSEGFRTKK